MNLPRGNVLLKPTPLELGDIQIQLANLKSGGFSGYVQAESGSRGFYVFVREGSLKNILEVSGKELALISDLLFRHRLFEGASQVSSYVLAPEIVDVLAAAHGFEEKYLKHQIRREDFPKVLGTLNSEKTTGMIEIESGAQSGGDSIYLVVEEGHIVTDNFLDAYGQIITGPEKVSELVNGFSEEGGILNVYGGRSEHIEMLGRQTLEALGLYREMLVAVEAAGLRLMGGNVVKVDEGLMREWSQTGSVQKIEIFVGNGPSETFKVAGKKGLGDRIAVPASVAKKLGLANGQAVLARPE